MERIWPLLWKFARDDRGNIAIEYGLIAGLISITIVGAARGIGAMTEAFTAGVIPGLSGGGTPP